MKHTIQTKWMLIISLLVLVGLFLSGCNSAEEAKDYQVGILSGVDTFNPVIEGFKAEMTELGFVEGENITYDIQPAGGDSEKMGQIAEQFVADEVDLIFVTTTGGTKAAQAATADTEIPVVFTIVLDPLSSGVVADLREPGANITGVSRPRAGFLGKRIEFLQQMAPDVERIWMPYRPDYATTEPSLAELRQAASDLGSVELVETSVNSDEEVIAELEKLSESDDPGFDAIMIMPDPVIQGGDSWGAILSFAAEHGLPIIANVPKQVEDGALFTYSDDNYETGQIAAPLADKILKGTDPAALPVAFGEPRLFINYNNAEAIGLSIPEGVLAQAEEIIR